MKKILFEYHSDDFYHVDFVVYETVKSIAIDYYVNESGCLVGVSYFRKSSKITDVLNYWKDDELNVMRILLEEFFGNGYRNKIYKVD